MCTSTWTRGDRRRIDDGQDTGADPTNDALISQLRDEVAYLRDENRRKDEIIMQQAMTMRQLSAPPSQEPPEDAETVEEVPERAEPHSEAGEVWEELGAERARREMAESTLREGMAEERRRREEAERERDELRREMFARREPRGAPEAAEEQQGRGEPRAATGEAQEGVRRPWWRRVFGG